MKKIQLAVNIAGIGDMVLASKSLRALKMSRPDTELWLMTSTEAAALATHFPYIDRVISFPIRELRKEKRKLLAIWKTMKDLRRISFCQIVNLYLIGSYLGALKMGFLFAMLQSDLKCGHGAFGFGRFLTRQAPADTFFKQHYADAMCDIAALTGATIDDGGLDVFWDKSGEDGLRIRLGKTPGKILIGINPGGHRPNRRWNPDYFSEVAMSLLAQYHARFVILGGPGEESLAEKISSRLPTSAVVNLSGKLSLHELCCVISQLHLLITNDSGPMHIAAAVRTPVAAIFGPERPLNLRPYADEHMYRVLYRDVPCRPCNRADCADALCLSSIPPDDVLSACQALIDIPVDRGLDRS